VGALSGYGEGDLGGIVSYRFGTDSEVGRLRAVLVHRPGPELKRVTPRTRDRLGFGGVPWVARAQREHDALTDVLRDRGAEVLYLTGLLQDVLEYAAARDEAIATVFACTDLGDDLGSAVRSHLESLPPEDLAWALVGGLTSSELRSGRGLVYELLDPHDFVVEPLPNMVFSRDSSVWVGDQAVVSALPGQRSREGGLMAAIYGHHPRFAGLRPHWLAGHGLDGGDILLLAPGVVAAGIGPRTTPASVEQMARHLLDAGVAHTVLAVPMSQRAHGNHLGRLCTVVDSGTVIMVPALAFTLTALTIASHLGELRVSRPRPFLEAAARAIGIDSLTVIDTGVDSHVGSSGQWDDGGNALAIGQRVTVCDERNVETNARLAAAGFEVITVPAGELGAIRGGPRCMCSPIHRDPDVNRDPQPASQADQPVVAPRRDPAMIDGAAVPEPAEPASQPGGRVGELTPMR
jgi:arginine deiminase